eukprot:comp17322_c0_seq1/m.16517 comp17322_c0_seq1/g.16517  ORF comp17322_c0_seq1/g.16517 comp17322_c0_seq1/m.16517 type:complete len:337 (-) comp17322_c0_seq1:386-1396(-)
MAPLLSLVGLAFCLVTQSSHAASLTKPADVVSLLPNKVTDPAEEAALRELADLAVQHVQRRANYAVCPSGDGEMTHRLLETTTNDLYGSLMESCRRIKGSSDLDGVTCNDRFAHEKNRMLCTKEVTSQARVVAGEVTRWQDQVDGRGCVGNNNNRPFSFTTIENKFRKISTITIESETTHTDSQTWTFNTNVQLGVNVGALSVGGDMGFSSETKTEDMQRNKRQQVVNEEIEITLPSQKITAPPRTNICFGRRYQVKAVDLRVEVPVCLEGSFQCRYGRPLDGHYLHFIDIMRMVDLEKRCTTHSYRIKGNLYRTVDGMVQGPCNAKQCGQYNSSN